MKLKDTGFFPLVVIFFFISSAVGEKLVEVVTPITKLHFLPSASSDTRGFVRKGQRFTVDGESGPWYRIRFYNAIVWVARDAVKVIDQPETPAAEAPPGGVSGQAQPSTSAAENASARSTQTPTPAPGAPTSAPTTAVSGSSRGAPPETLTEGTKPPQGKTPPLALTQPGEGGTNRTPPPSPSPNVRSAYPTTRPKRAVPVEPTERTWFSQFSNIHEVPSNGFETDIVFFQDISNETPIYSLSNNTASVLTKAKKGDFFPLIEEHDSWCKIAFNDTTGWIERTKGAIVSTPTKTHFDEYHIIIIVAASVIIIAIVLLFAMRRKGRPKKQTAEPFHALVLAKSSPNVQTVISNKTIPLEKYLVVIGFTVKAVHELAGAQKVVDKHPFDVVFIDWNMTNDIPGTIEILFANYDEKKLPLAIFYNMPDASEAPLIPVLLRAYHLGSSFTDHDISKLITPAMLSRTGQRGAAASALEGDIAEGNLPEIMQFIELGKKTGCLLIDAESPLGMIYFAQGRIIHAAAANGVIGKGAINLLLGLKQGKFRFLLGKQPKASDLNLSTLEVLMEWTKAEDEAHRD